MKDRIKKIRKDAGLSQDAFAKRIGLSRNMISQVEADMASFSDRSLNDICREFRINFEWLKNGIGDMYVARSDDQILAEFVNDLMESRDDDFKKRLILALSQLPDDSWDVLSDLVDRLK